MIDLNKVLRYQQL